LNNVKILSLAHKAVNKLCDDHFTTRSRRFKFIVLVILTFKFCNDYFTRWNSLFGNCFIENLLLSMLVKEF